MLRYRTAYHFEMNEFQIRLRKLDHSTRAERPFGNLPNGLNVLPIQKRGYFLHLPFGNLTQGVGDGVGVGVGPGSGGAVNNE